MTQPTALRLADELEYCVGGAVCVNAAAEIRRLEEENKALKQTKAELLEALCRSVSALANINSEVEYSIVRAAIAKAQGEQT